MGRTKPFEQPSLAVLSPSDPARSVFVLVYAVFVRASGKQWKAHEEEPSSEAVAIAAAQYLDKDRLIMTLSRYDQNWCGPSFSLDARLRIKVLPPMTYYCKSFVSAVINHMMKSPSGQTHSSSLPGARRDSAN